MTKCYPNQFPLINFSLEQFSKNYYKSSHPEVFLVKGVLKISIKFTGEHPCRSVISIKLSCNFIEITLRHGCSPLNLLHIFGTHLNKNTSRWLLLLLQLNLNQIIDLDLPSAYAKFEEKEKGAMVVIVCRFLFLVLGKLIIR